MVVEKRERRREKGRKRERGSHRGMHKENISPKALAWKTKGAEFCEFLKPVELKALSFTG